MKNITIVIVFVPLLLLIGCSEKATTEAEKPDAVTEAINATPAPGAGSESKTGGGYVPSSSERVPGVTMTQEELENMYSEARSSIPMPEIAKDDDQK